MTLNGVQAVVRVSLKYNLFMSDSIIPLHTILQHNTNINYFEDVSIGDYNNDGMDDLYCYGDKENNSVAKSTIKG